jgi:hypothetical protein
LQQEREVVGPDVQNVCQHVHGGKNDQESPSVWHGSGIFLISFPNATHLGYVQNIVAWLISKLQRHPVESPKTDFKLACDRAAQREAGWNQSDSKADSIYDNRCVSIIAALASVGWILIPTCFSLFNNCDRMISFFDWKLFSQPRAYLFAFGSIVQLFFPFQATVLVLIALFGPKKEASENFGKPTWAASFLLQTLVLSYIGATICKAGFSLDYVFTPSRFLWPFDCFFSF